MTTESYQESLFSLLDFAFWDFEYGVLDKEDQPWDHALDDLKIADRLRGFEQCNSGDDTVYLLLYNQLESGKFNKILVDSNQFSLVQPLFVSSSVLNCHSHFL